MKKLLAILFTIVIIVITSISCFAVDEVSQDQLTDVSSSVSSELHVYEDEITTQSSIIFPDNNSDYVVIKETYDPNNIFYYFITLNLTGNNRFILNNYQYKNFFYYSDDYNAESNIINIYKTFDFLTYTISNRQILTSTLNLKFIPYENYHSIIYSSFDIPETNKNSNDLTKNDLLKDNNVFFPRTPLPMEISKTRVVGGMKASEIAAAILAQLKQVMVPSLMILTGMISLRKLLQMLETLLSKA